MARLISHLARVHAPVCAVGRVCARVTAWQRRAVQPHVHEHARTHTHTRAHTRTTHTHTHQPRTTTTTHTRSHDTDQRTVTAATDSSKSQEPTASGQLVWLSLSANTAHKCRTPKYYQHGQHAPKYYQHGQHAPMAKHYNRACSAEGKRCCATRHAKVGAGGFVRKYYLTAAQCKSQRTATLTATTRVCLQVRFRCAGPTNRMQYGADPSPGYTPPHAHVNISCKLKKCCKLKAGILCTCWLQVSGRTHTAHIDCKFKAAPSLAVGCAW